MPDPTPPPELSPEEKERRQHLLAEKLKSLGWLGFALFIAAVVFLPLTADAFRTLVPSAGTKLSKLPLVGSFFNTPSFEKIDRAYVGAIAIYLAVMTTWTRIQMMWKTDDRTDGERFRMLVTTLGIVLLVADLALFYCAIAEVTWSDVKFSWIGLLLAIVYGGVLLWTASVSARIKLRIKKLEET